MNVRWTPVAYMAGTGALGLATATALAGDATHPEVAMGLAGPLTGGVVSWLLMVEAAAESQAKLMGLMMKAMAAKMLLFPAYVGVLFLVFEPRPVPFVGSFAGFFVALYAIQALFLKRLVAPAIDVISGVPGREA